jgi:hypothetical protein
VSGRRARILLTNDGVALWLCWAACDLSACAPVSAPEGAPRSSAEALARSEANTLKPLVVETVALYQAPPPPAPPPPPPPAREVVTETELDRRLTSAGAGTGSVQVSLAWGDYNDLDLHLKTPCGTHIFYPRQSRRSCGMFLDVDRNNDDSSNTPIENIRPTGAVRPGRYHVFVDFYSTKSGGADPTEYVVRVIVMGTVKLYRGRITSSENGARMREIATFEVN